jgi:hypothetical protein
MNSGQGRPGAGAMSEFIDSADRLGTEVFTGHDANVPGLTWELSEDTRQAIRAIDENIRAAEQTSGQLTLG